MITPLPGATPTKPGSAVSFAYIYRKFLLWLKCNVSFLMLISFQLIRLFHSLGLPQSSLMRRVMKLKVKERAIW